MFAQAVTVSKTAWQGDCLTCKESQGIWFTGKLNNIMFYLNVDLHSLNVGLNIRFVLVMAAQEESSMVQNRDV